MSPAAGPETPNLEPLRAPTTTPPTTPAIIPENILGKLSIPCTSVEAKAIPKQSGRATRYTTTLEGKSFFQLIFLVLVTFLGNL